MEDIRPAGRMSLLPYRPFAIIDTAIIANAQEKRMKYDTGDAALAFFELKDRKSRSRPMYLGCLSLRLAVIEDAHRIITFGPGTHDESRAKYREAKAWIRGGTNSHPGFSLRELCEVFGWDHRETRNALLAHLSD